MWQLNHRLVLYRETVGAVPKKVIKNDSQMIIWLRIDAYCGTWITITAYKDHGLAQDMLASLGKLLISLYTIQTKECKEIPNWGLKGYK